MEGWRWKGGGGGGGLRAHSKDCDQGDGDDSQREHRESDEAPLRPLDFCPPHEPQQLCPLRLSLRRLPVFRRSQWAQQHKDACEPEEWEHYKAKESGRDYFAIERGARTEPKLEEVHRERRRLSDRGVRGEIACLGVRRRRDVVLPDHGMSVIVAAVEGAVGHPRDSKEVVDGVGARGLGARGESARRRRRGDGRGPGLVCARDDLRFEVDGLVGGTRRGRGPGAEDGADGGGSDGGRHF